MDQGKWWSRQWTRGGGGLDNGGGCGPDNGPGELVVWTMDQGRWWSRQWTRGGGVCVDVSGCARVCVCMCVSDILLVSVQSTKLFKLSNPANRTRVYNVVKRLFFGRVSR